MSLLQTRHQRRVRHARSKLMRRVARVLMGRVACVLMGRVARVLMGRVACVLMGRVARTWISKGKANACSPLRDLEGLPGYTPVRR